MDYVPIRFFPNYMDAHMALGQLQEQGIDCWLKDENTVTTIPIWTHAVGGIKLMVAAADVEDANKLLNSSEHALQCPKCGSTEVSLVSTNRSAGNWLTAIGSWLLGSYAIAPEKAYHCFTCQHEFELTTEEGEVK